MELSKWHSVNKNKQWKMKNNLHQLQLTIIPVTFEDRNPAYHELKSASVKAFSHTA